MSFMLVFRRYAPFAQFGFGFEGDHRLHPSVSMDTTARTIGIVSFGRGNIGSIRATTSGTQYTAGGEWLRLFLRKHQSDVSSTATKKQVSQNCVSFTASTAGANPMLGRAAPTIDTFIDFRAEWIGNGVRFNGAVRGDNFPNAEVFVLDSKGQGCLLFDGRTTGGQDSGPITRLAGDHEELQLGLFHCSMPVSPSGTFLTPRISSPVTIMK
jgi:hypothetical protein